MITEFIVSASETDTLTWSMEAMVGNQMVVKEIIAGVLTMPRRRSLIESRFLIRLQTKTIAGARKSKI